MQRRSGTESDPAPDLTGRVHWRVTAVDPLPGYRLRVTFRDGATGEVDMSDLIRASAGVFAAIRDEAAFAAVQVADGVVTWPGGLDLAPDAMYYEIVANGTWKVPPFPNANPPSRGSRA